MRTMSDEVLLRFRVATLLQDKGRLALVAFAIALAFASQAVSLGLINGIGQNIKKITTAWGINRGVIPKWPIVGLPKVEPAWCKDDIDGLNEQDVASLNARFGREAIFYPFLIKSCRLSLLGRRTTGDVIPVDRCALNAFKALAPKHVLLADGSAFPTDGSVGEQRLCMIGLSISRKLFPFEPAVGKRLKINDIPFVVVGVLYSQGRDWANNDLDSYVYVPYKVGKRLFFPDERDINIGFVSFPKAGTTDLPPRIDKFLMSRKVHIPPAAHYKIGTSDSIAASYRHAMGNYTALTTILAAISFVLAGSLCGHVLNLSVEQQGHTVALKRALGATHQAMVLEIALATGCIVIVGSLLGGGLAVAVGHTLTAHFLIKGTTLSDFPVVFSWKNVVGGVLFILGSVIFACWLPTRKALLVSPASLLSSERQ